MLCGALAGFLRYNFNPASIFLGVSGSNLLGYMLAAIAVQGALKTNAVVALVFPLVIATNVVYQHLAQPWASPFATRAASAPCSRHGSGRVAISPA